MSGFKLDFNETFEGFEKIEDGTYEVIIDHAREDATKSGAEFTNFQMTIRNDLDQPHKNQKLWHRAWKTKATGKYNMLIFNTIGKAAQLENNKNYTSMDELLEDYTGKPVQVFVQNEKSEYNGKEYENLNVKSWKQTKFPEIQHQFKSDKNESNQGPGSGPSGDITDSDLPF